jgi:hypothetical protein
VTSALLRQCGSVGSECLIGGSKSIYLQSSLLSILRSWPCGFGGPSIGPGDGGGAGAGGAAGALLESSPPWAGSGKLREGQPLLLHGNGNARNHEECKQ